MKKIIPLTLIATLAVLSVSLLVMAASDRMDAPRPLQGQHGQSDLQPANMEGIVSIAHPAISNSTVNFQPSHDVITIGDQTFSLGNFVLTPGAWHNEDPDPDLLFLTDGFRGSSLTSQFHSSYRDIYIADVRGANIGGGETAIVPPITFITGKLDPYSSPYSYIPIPAPAYSIAKMAGSEDIVMVTYDPLEITPCYIQPCMKPGPIFYLKRVMPEGLYRLAGVLLAQNTQLPNGLPLDIETLDANKDGLQDIAVLNRLTKSSGVAYVLFFLANASNWNNGAWTDINSAFIWPQKTYVTGLYPFDMAVTSDKINDQWRDSLIVPTFARNDIGAYIAYKISLTPQNGSAETTKISLGEPGFIQNDSDCTTGKVKCGPVRIKCTRYTPDRTFNDLNDDKCGDCVITWAKLFTDAIVQPYLVPFGSFTVHMNMPANNVCSDTAYGGQIVTVTRTLPSGNADVMLDGGTLPPLQAFAIDIASANTDVDDYLDVWIGDQSLYPNIESGLDSFVYLYKNSLQNDSWQLLTGATDVEVYKAGYRLTRNRYGTEFGGGVKAIAADAHGNLGIINGYPFVPDVVESPAVPASCATPVTDAQCPSGISNATYTVTAGMTPYENGTCIPDCAEFDGPETYEGALVRYSRPCLNANITCGSCQMQTGGVECPAGRLDAHYGIPYDYMILPTSIDRDGDCVPDCAFATIGKDIKIHTICDRDFSGPQENLIDELNQCCAKPHRSVCIANCNNDVASCSGTNHAADWIDDYLGSVNTNNVVDVNGMQVPKNDINYNCVPDCRESVPSDNLPFYPGFYPCDYEDYSATPRVKFDCSAYDGDGAFIFEQGTLSKLVAMISDLLVAPAYAGTPLPRSEATFLLNKSKKPPLPECGANDLACICNRTPEDSRCLCFLHPDDASCTTSECAPTDTRCLCEKNPDLTGCFCVLNPNDPSCASPACEPEDIDCICKGDIGCICKAKPSDPRCAPDVYCSITDDYLKDPACYCRNHPTDAKCQPVPFDCTTHPDDPACKLIPKTLDNMQACTVAIDREGDLEGDPYKGFKLYVRDLNDRARAIIGTDVFIPEYVGTYVATVYRPVANVAVMNPEKSAVSPQMMAPLYQYSGMKVENYQAMRMRPVYEDFLVRPERPNMLLPTKKIQSTANMPGVPGSIIVAPDDAVTERSGSNFDINSAVNVTFRAAQGGMMRKVNQKLALVSPFVAEVRGIAGVDGCAWSTPNCPIQVPSPQQRGLDPEAFLKTAQKVVDEFSKAGAVKTPQDIIEETLRRTPWDTTGYLEQRFSFAGPETVDLGGKTTRAMKTANLMNKDATGSPLGLSLVSPDEDKLIKANVAAYSAGKGCDSFTGIVFPMSKVSSPQGAGCCKSNLSGRTSPSVADLVIFLMIAGFVAAVCIRRKRCTR